MQCIHGRQDVVIGRQMAKQRSIPRDGIPNVIDLQMSLILRDLQTLECYYRMAYQANKH